MVYVTSIRERFPGYNIHSSHDSFPQETNGFSVSPFIRIITLEAAAANYRDLKLQNLRGKDHFAILQNPRRQNGMICCCVLSLESRSKFLPSCPRSSSLQAVYCFQMGTESRSTVVAVAIPADDHLLVSSYNPATRFLLQPFSNAFHGDCAVRRGRL